MFYIVNAHLADFCIIIQDYATEDVKKDLVSIFLTLLRAHHFQFFDIMAASNWIKPRLTLLWKTQKNKIVKQENRIPREGTRAKKNPLKKAILGQKTLG